MHSSRISVHAQFLFVQIPAQITDNSYLCKSADYTIIDAGNLRNMKNALEKVLQKHTWI